MVTLLGAGALAVGLSTAAAVAAHASPVPNSDWNELIPKFDNGRSNTLCIDDTNGSTASGNPLQLVHCHASGSDGVPQRWHFTQIGVVVNPGETAWEMRLADGAGPFCVTDTRTPATAPASGTRVFLDNCDGRFSQIWVMDTDPARPSR
jgi:hypothetical protein